VDDAKALKEGVTLSFFLSFTTS